jgi:hypothetical protein
MARERTWTFSSNTTPTDQTTALRQAASFWVQLKTFLLANGWTVAQTCDASSVSGSDLLTSVTSGWTWAASAGAHSWYVLKSPAGIVAGLDGSSTGDQSCIWFSVDCNYANVYQIKAYFHNVAPTGGTTTAAPTSAQQLGWATQSYLKTTLVSTTLWNFAINSKGAFTANIVYSLTGYSLFALAATSLTDLTIITSSGLTYPYGICFFCQTRDSSPGVFWDANGLAALTSGEDGGIISDKSGTTVKAWNVAGVAVSSRAGGVVYAVSGSGQVGCYAAQVTTATGDTVNNQLVKLPVFVGYPSQHIGRMEDFYQARSVYFGPGIANGTVTPSISSVEYALFSCFWQPYDTAVSL